MKQFLVIGVVGAALLMPALTATAEDQGATAVPQQPVVTKQAPAQAPDAATPAKVKKEVVLQDLTLTGKVTSETITRYYLTDASGAKVPLPGPNAGKKGAAEAPAINLADYVGATVKVTAKGTETVSKKGGTTTNVTTIISIEKVP